MATLKSCCCCLSLRTGTFMALAFSTTMGALGVLDGLILLYDVKAKERDIESENAEMTLLILKTTMYVSVGLYGGWILLALLGMCAVNCGNRCILIPWIVFTGVINALCIWGVISSVKIMPGNFQEPQKLSTLATQIAVIIINTYSLCVISSFYRNNMKEYGEEFSSVPTSVPGGPDDEYGYKE